MCTEYISLVPRVLDLEAPTRAGLRAYFDQSWQLNAWLFSALRDEEAFAAQPDPLRHPLIFYWGHTAAFYNNKLRMAGLVERSIDPHLEELLAQGVDPNAAADLEHHELWPTLAEVNVYRARVRETVGELIDRVAIEPPIHAGQPLWALLMAMEHDRIHFETSSVLIRQAALSSLRRPEHWTYAPTAGSETFPAREVLVDAGQTFIGKRDRGSFGWDNEYGELVVDVPAFSVGTTLVTNRELLEFVDDGGYQREKLWTPEGWRWRQQQRVIAPRFWRRDGDGFVYRAMFDELPMPHSWPAEVNAHEAHAYCQWRGDGARLPREAEWLRLLDLSAPAAPQRDGHGYNLHLRYGSPSPVAGVGDDIVGDLRGNVWQWLSDDFYPLPGFAPHPLYMDFSTPYFDAEHAMLRGGAWATAGAGTTADYRLWFRHHFYQHAGFRVARTAS